MKDPREGTGAGEGIEMKGCFIVFCENRIYIKIFITIYNK